MNGTIWYIPKNCFEVNLLTVNVWSVYMLYMYTSVYMYTRIPISLASNKAFLDKKGAEWERWGSFWLGNVLWGRVVSNNTEMITDLHVGILGGPLIQRDLKNHPLAFLSVFYSTKEREYNYSAGEGCGHSSICWALDNVHKTLVLLTAPYKLGMVVCLLILAPRK